MQALIFILDTLLKLVVCAFLLRLLLPLVRADLRNPIGQAVLNFTSPLVMPLRKVFRPVGRVDVASLAALLLVQLAGTAVLRLAAGLTLAPGPLLLHGLLDLAHTTLQFYFMVVLAYVILSWVAPGNYSPVGQLIGRLSEPLLQPFRRVIPPIAGLDFSAVFVLIALQALQILLR
jgi:YggT family protein